MQLINTLEYKNLLDVDADKYFVETLPIYSIFINETFDEHVWLVPTNIRTDIYFKNTNNDIQLIFNSNYNYKYIVIGKMPNSRYLNYVKNIIIINDL